MALDKQIFNISFAKGLDTKTDDKQVIPGKLLTLENAVFKKVGKFVKRNGYGVIANNAGISNGNALATFKNELLAFDGSTISSYSASDDKLYSRGTKIAVDLSVQSIARNSYEQTAPDSAYHSNGITAYAWQDSSGGVRYSVFDTTTQLAIVSNGLVSSIGSKPKLKTIGSNILIFFIENNDFKYFKINASSPSTVYSAVTLANDIADYYDVSYFNSQVYVAYATGTTTSIFSLSSSLVQSALTVVSEAASCLSIFSDGSNNVWVAYATASAVKYFVRDSAITGVVLAPTTIESVVAVNIAGVYDGTGKIWYEVAGDVSSNQYVKYCTGSVSGSVGTPSVFLRSVGLYSKPFIVGSSVYITVTHDSDLQPTYFIVNGSGSVVTKLAPSLGGGLSTTGLLAEVNLLSSNNYLIAYEFKDFVQSVNGDVTTQTGINSATITFAAPIVTSEIANNLNVSGGIVSMYDGQNIVEKGFNLYPEGVSVSTVYGGGSLSDGQYQYSAIYEWTDAQGQIHRSAPSVPVDIDTSYSVTTVKLQHDNGTNPKFLKMIPPSTGEAFEDTFANLRVGNEITGGRLSPGTFITNIFKDFSTYGTTVYRIYLNQSYTTGANTNDTFTVKSNYNFIGSSTIGSTTLETKQTSFASFFGSADNGSNVLKMNRTYGLKPGMQIENLTSYYSGTPTITGVFDTYVELTLSATSSFSNKNVWVTYPISIPGSGSISSFTLAIPPLGLNYYVGQSVFSKGVSGVSYGSSYDPDTGVEIQSITKLPASWIITLSGSISVGATTAYTMGMLVNHDLIENQSINVSAGFDSPRTIKSINVNDLTLDRKASATSSSLIVSTSQGFSSSVSVPTLRITDKKSDIPVNIALYRTVSNGSVFYRVNPSSTPSLNDTTLDSVTILDTISDENIVGNEQLYTTGGEVENIAPPASNLIGTYKNRLLVRPNEDALAFWYSKQVRTNTPVEFNDTFIQRVPERGGGITAFQQMDDKLIIFKQDCIFVMVGDGPSVSGVNNDFTDPQLITADCGCSDKKSVVVLPTGLIFKSQKGFYFLDRALNVKYIGADVEAYNSYSVNSSKMIETDNQVRFNLSSGDTLVYDYYVEQWDLFKGIAAVDSVSFQDRYTYILSNGEIRRETPGAYLDKTSLIPVKLETGWLNLAGLQGFQRIYYFLILGTYKSPHTLQIDLYRDFIETPFETITIPVLSAPTKYQYRIFPSIQKCEAMKIKITETQSAPYGEGFDLSGIALEVGVKRGPNRVSPDESFG